MSADELPSVSVMALTGLTNKIVETIKQRPVLTHQHRAVEEIDVFMIRLCVSELVIVGDKHLSRFY